MNENRQRKKRFTLVGLSTLLLASSVLFYSSLLLAIFNFTGGPTNLPVNNTLMVAFN